MSLPIPPIRKKFPFGLSFGLHFIFLILLCVNSYSQQVKTAGLPSIKNFTPKEYQGHDQNWNIVQDKRGIMYFANTLGLLEYDGTFWKKINMPNKSIVRSLSIDESTGRIYVGAQNEIGYLSSDSVGNTKYISMLNLVPEDERVFNNVWSIRILSEKIVFVTFTKLIIVKNGSCKIIKTQTRFHSSFKINNQLYVREAGKGIKILDGDSLTLIKGSEMFADERIYAMQPFEKNKILIGTRTQNFFLYDGTNFSKFQTSCEDLFRSGQIYCSWKISDSFYAIGTVLNGLIIINKSGQLIQHLNNKNGLISNNIRAIYSDNSKNLWTANDFGISKIDINSPFTYFDERYNLNTKSPVGIYYNNKLFVGGLPFLFYTNDYTTADAEFTKIEESRDQVWNAFPFDNKLFLAQSSDQGYLDKNNKYTSISKLNNSWTYASMPDRPDYLMMGTGQGLYYLIKTNNTWKMQGQIEGFNLTSRYILTDSLSNIWVEVPNDGIYRLRLNEKGDRITEQKKLLEIFTNNEVMSIVCNQLIVANDSKILKYNYETEKLEDYNVLNKLFPDSNDITIRRISQNGDFYFQDSNSIGKLIKKSEQEYDIYRKPFFALEAISEYLPVLEIDESNVIIGRNKGFIHYQPNYPKDYSQPFNTLIRKVEILKTDEVIFGGNFPLNSDSFSLEQPNNQIPVFDYKHNSFRFLYSATFFESTQNTRYSYKLEGFEKDWSPWTEDTKKEYTKIPEGDYTFKVKAKNVYGTESAVAVYKFEVLPPWYRTWWAYTVYVLLFAFLLFLGFRLNTRRRQVQKAYLKKIVKKRTAELEKANKKLSLLATLDGLTGISNRRKFSELLNSEWKRAIRSKKPLSIILIDIDFFKNYNDFYGHLEGDECLKKVAQSIKKAIKRSIDFVGRYGGEEFVIVLPETGIDGALLIAEKARQNVEAMNLKHEKSNTADHITISLGVASLIASKSKEPSELVKLADDALYQSKENGRNRITVAEKT